MFIMVIAMSAVQSAGEYHLIKKKGGEKEKNEQNKNENSGDRDFFADWNFYSDSIAVSGCRDNG